MTNEQRDHLIKTYLEQGYVAAEPLAIEYGITPKHISGIARKAGHYFPPLSVRVLKAKAIFRQTLIRRKVARDDVCNSNRPEFVAIRADAIKELSGLGFSFIVISKALGISPDAAKYWVRAEYRAKKIKHRHAALKREREARLWRKAIAIGEVRA